MHNIRLIREAVSANKDATAKLSTCFQKLRKITMLTAKLLTLIKKPRPSLKEYAVWNFLS